MLHVFRHFIYVWHTVICQFASWQYRWENIAKPTSSEQVPVIISMFFKSLHLSAAREKIYKILPVVPNNHNLSVLIPHKWGQYILLFSFIRHFFYSCVSHNPSTFLFIPLLLYLHSYLKLFWLYPKNSDIYLSIFTGIG